MRYFRINCTLLVLCLAVLFTSAAMSAQFYMFKDNKGRTQIQDSIPAEYIKYGYKIVNDRGATIKVVPSEREQRKQLKVQRQQQSATKRARQEQEDQEEQDERLLQSFSNAEEIRQAGNKKILVIQAQIDSTLKHVEAFERNLEELQAQRATDDAGDDESIEKVRESIQQNNDFILRKRNEQNNIRDEYIGYIKRYEMLSIRR